MAKKQEFLGSIQQKAKGKYTARQLKPITRNENIQGEVREILIKLSIKYNLPYVAIKKIYTAPFDMMYKFMRMFDLENPYHYRTYKLPFAGRFYMNKASVKQRRKHKGLPEDP